ncbi:MAG: hypothetical protein J0I32_03530 [Sphingobacteriales bacterium]|nr:hypothetical protein [Sphingobacteriales bacterium]OJW05074.1 MAG: hypothetical protein BGO52_21590 [Sphingobacteriales bacterium 44-61]
MKYLFLPGCIFLFSAMLKAQSGFPHGWEGNWKGELLWYTETGKEPKKVNMELRIHRQDTAWGWQLIYGFPSEDNRPYTLFAKDTTKGHWAINEHNDIVLDQFFLAGRLSGAFTVGNTTILNTYQLQGDSLVVEFNNLQAKPLSTSGKGTAESPTVESYRVKGYQRAVLRRK